MNVLRAFERTDAEAPKAFDLYQLLTPFQKLSHGPSAGMDHVQFLNRQLFNTLAQDLVS